MIGRRVEKEYTGQRPDEWPSSVEASVHGNPRGIEALDASDQTLEASVEPLRDPVPRPNAERLPTLNRSTADTKFRTGPFASEAEVTFRFGTDTTCRRRLALRLRRWIELSRASSATRFFVDGSFVTAKPEPNDVDAVVWLPDDFAERVSNGNLQAIELETMLLT